MNTNGQQGRDPKIEYHSADISKKPKETLVKNVVKESATKKALKESFDKKNQTKLITLICILAAVIIGGLVTLWYFTRPVDTDAPDTPMTDITDEEWNGNLAEIYDEFYNKVVNYDGNNKQANDTNVAGEFAQLMIEIETSGTAKQIHEARLTYARFLTNVLQYYDVANNVLLAALSDFDASKVGGIGKYHILELLVSVAVKTENTANIVAYSKQVLELPSEMLPTPDGVIIEDQEYYLYMYREYINKYEGQ